MPSSIFINMCIEIEPNSALDNSIDHTSNKNNIFEV